MTFGGDKIGRITISKSLSGMGISGVVTSQLTAVIWAPEITEFPEFTEVTVGGFTLPTFYMSEISNDEGVVTINAYDACRFLSLPFDYSSFNVDVSDNDKDKDKDKDIKSWNVNLVMDAVGNQAHFSSVSVPQRVQKIKQDIFKGKSMLSICEEVSAANAGFFYCSTDNVLAFCAAGSSSSATFAYDGEYSAVKTYPDKIITRLIADNTSDNERYDIGSGDYTKSLQTSGMLISKPVAEQIASQLFSGSGSYTYRAFDVQAIINGNIDPMGQFTAGEKNYMPKDISIELCAMGALAQLAAPAVSSSALEYTEYYQREINDRIKANSTYKNVVLNNKNGLTLTDGETENTFNVFGSVAEFTGALVDKTMPSEIVPISATSQKIVYDTVSYILSWEKGEDGKKKNIQLKEEESA